MTWVWAGVSFALWVLIGWFVGRRSSSQLRIRLAEMTRTQRALLGSVGLLGGLAILIGGVALVAVNGGIRQGVLQPWAWLAVMILGGAFIAIQILGVGALLSLALDGETAAHPQASIPKEKQKS